MLLNNSDSNSKIHALILNYHFRIHKSKELFLTFKLGFNLCIYYRLKNKQLFIRAGGKDLEVFNSDWVICLFKMFKYFAVINFIWIDVASSEKL